MWKSAFNKCLNDLMSFRCIFDFEENLDEIYGELDKLPRKSWDGKIKLLRKNENEYNAIHVYISKTNSCLPW